MKKTTDVHRGTLALMVLKTLDVLGPAPRLRPRQAHRANQRRRPHAQHRHALSAPPEVGTGRCHCLGAGPSENNRSARFYRLTRAGRKQLEAETRAWEQTTAQIERFFAVKAKDLP